MKSHPHPASSQILASLAAISHETTMMLAALDEEAESLSANDAREAKRRAFEIRSLAQEFFDWVSAARLEEPRN